MVSSSAFARVTTVFFYFRKRYKLNNYQYWIYTHCERINCKKVLFSDLEGLIITFDLKVLYPCNRTGFDENCLCDLKLKCFVIQIGNVMSVIQNSTENGIWRDILWSFMKLMLNMTLPVRKEVTWRQVLVFFNQRIVLSLMHPMMIQKMKLVKMLINHSYVGIVEKSFQLQVGFIQTKDSVSVMFAG